VLRVTYSNLTEALVAALAERLPRDPFVEATVVVPNRAMERVVEVGLARARGIVANVRFARLERWVETELATSDDAFLSPAELEARLLAVLSDPGLGELATSSDPLAVVAGYILAADGRWTSKASERRRLELAPRLAHLFGEYALTRPDWIRGWMAGSEGDEVASGRTATWQRALYRRIRALGEPRTTLAERLSLGRGEPRGGGQARTAPRAEAGPVFVLGVSYAAPVFHHAIAQIARARDVELLVVNPCREFWADAVRDGEGVANETDSRLLLSWGRPGREHMARLDEAVGFDATTRFVDPVRALRGRRGAESSLLSRVQASILTRSAVEATPPDGSIAVLPCPGLRREVETVAQLVWGLVADADRRAQEQGEEPLRLPEIAILVQASERERYLPHLEAVLGDGSEPEHLPWSAQDLSLAARSRVAEAVLRLLAFLETTPTRRELLSVISHPLVRPTTLADEGTTERDWAELVERAGIVRGIDEGDLLGTYAAAEAGQAQVLHFDQGLRRLALGCALGDSEVPGDSEVLGDAEVEEHAAGGAASGEEPRENDARLEAANVGARSEEAMALVMLARSLLADHRAVEQARLTPGAWGLLFEALAEGYVRPESGAEERELERCRSALRGIASFNAQDPSGLEGEITKYGSELGLALARRALEGLPAVRGEPQSTGIVVASLLPMRAIPFRVVFVLGMGERQFPSDRMDLGLDLRTGQRRAGDVAPDERDRYAFLETLISTRERLFLSYVARDEHTGDAVGPSSVVNELAEACGGLREHRPPRRRHESLDFAWLEGAGLEHPATRAAMTAAVPAALAERSVRARGDGERVHFRDVEIATEAWARIPTTDTRRAELSLTSLSIAQREPGGEDVPPVVQLRGLRRFLECPIQGRGLQWLGSEAEERSLLVSEEPLEAEDHVLDRIAREAFARALEDGLGARPEASLAQAIARAVVQAQRRAQVPVGALADDVMERARARAAHWLEALHVARPAVRHARGLRFGRVSMDRARAEPRLEARDAVRLAATTTARARGPGSSASGEPDIVLEGRTRPFLRASHEGRPGDLVTVVVGRSAGGSEPARLSRWRAALDAYVDHAVLAASGEERLSRRAVLLCSDGPYETTLPALTRDAASRWLRAVAVDLLGRGPEGTTPWFVPVEAVLLEEEAMRRGDARLADRLTRAVERVRTKLEGGSSRHGPIRGATAYDAPESAELLRVVARRHAAFLSAVRAPVRVTTGDSEGLLR